MSSGQVPSVGRAVHYVSYGTPGGEFTSKCRAATVTDVRVVDGVFEARLTVFNPEGLFFTGWLREDADEKKGGTWHWPERV